MTVLRKKAASGIEGRKLREYAAAGVLAGAVAVVLLAIATIFYVTSGEETTHLNVPAVDLQPMSREDVVRDLVNRGLVPRQALDLAPTSREDIVRDLVNRGLVPRQSLNE